MLALHMFLVNDSFGSLHEKISTVTAKGQVTLPVEIRKFLGIQKNDKVAFVIEPAGEVRLAAPKYPNLASLRGAAGSLPKPLSWNTMKNIAMEERYKTKYAK